MTIYTIGYEDAHLHDFLHTLTEAGVQLVVDTRERAQSRRQGYSKTALTAALGEQGIEYRHLRGLGTPPAIRKAYRLDHDFAALKAGYTLHLGTQGDALHELADLAAVLRAGWPGPLRVGLVEARIILGDARATLPRWRGRADAWFLDGFSPARNPELWSDDLMAEVAAHTAPGGSFATYTAAGHVRRALAGAGFAVERAPGFAGKRHMSRGVLA